MAGLVPRSRFHHGSVSQSNSIFEVQLCDGVVWWCEGDFNLGAILKVNESFVFKSAVIQSAPEYPEGVVQ